MKRYRLFSNLSARRTFLRFTLTLVLLSLLSSVCCLFSCGEDAVAQYDLSEIEKPEIVYKTIGEKELSLDILYPTNRRRGLNPTVLVIHGGGWVSGSKEGFYRDFEPLIGELRADGVTVVGVEYRLAVNGLDWTACLEDCEDALDFVVDNAEDYDIDPERIGIIGYSAGAQLGLLTAIERDGVKYCVSMSAPMIMTFDKTSRFYSESLEYYGKQAFGDTLPENSYLSSPSTRLTRRRGTSFLLISGKSDNVVTPAHAKLFLDEAENLGVSAELISKRGLTHFYPNYVNFEPLCETIAKKVVENLF